MVKIVANHNKQDVTHTYKLGQTFPDVEGKLLSVEAITKRNVIISSIGAVCFLWAINQQ